MSNYNSKNKAKDQNQIFNDLKVHILKVIELTKKGYTKEEISEKITCEEPVQFLIRIAKKNNMWFSAEELKEFKLQRKGRNLGETEIHSIEKTENNSKEILKVKQEQKRQENLEMLKKLYRLGYNESKIARIMGYEAPYIGQMRRKFIKEGNWFGEEELKEVELERKRIKDIEDEKKKRILQERNERYKEQMKTKTRKKRKKRKENSLNTQVNKYKTRLNKLRVEAKKEDKLEANGEENISTEGRKQFFDFLVEINSYGINISESDFEIMMNSFYFHPELATKNNIKLIISESAKNGGYPLAYKTISELMEALDDEKTKKVLQECREWIRERELFSKINKFKEQKLTNTQIGKELGITSAEVAILLDKDVEFIEHDEK